MEENVTAETRSTMEAALWMIQSVTCLAPDTQESTAVQGTDSICIHADLLRLARHLRQPPQAATRRLHRRPALRLPQAATQLLHPRRPVLQRLQAAILLLLLHRPVLRPPRAAIPLLHQALPRTLLRHPLPALHTTQATPHPPQLAQPHPTPQQPHLPVVR
jgi:hypothetical protein